MISGSVNMSTAYKVFESSQYFNGNMGFISSIISGLFCLCLYIIYTKVIRVDPRLKRLLSKFPGPKGYPILGSALEFLVPNHEVLPLFQKFSQCGKTFRFWIGTIPYLLVGDANGVEKLLSSTQHIDKARTYELLQPWLGTGLLTSTGKKWHKRRKLLTPTFHFRILEDFVEIFNEQSLIFADKLSSDCADTNNVFDIVPYITRCTLDIICETAMGTKMNAQLEKDSEYVNTIYGYTDILVKRELQPWLHQPFIWKLFGYGRQEDKYLNVLHSFTENVIKDRKKSRKLRKESQKLQDTTDLHQDDDIHMNKKRRAAFLDLLLDASETTETLSDLDIREEVDTFMFEGQDTTGAHLGWTLFLLGKHPEIQKRVQMELDEILGTENNQAVTMNDASRMKYLECCVKESLRLYPSVPFYGRQMQHDMDLGNGLIVPAGVTCFVCPYLLHRDPTIFPDPEKFNPDRFLLENCEGRNPYAYVPFSAGPRNCIGQKFAQLETKVVLAQLFRSYSFEAVDDVDDLKIVPDLITRAKDGLRFRVFKRNFCNQLK